MGRWYEYGSGRADRLRALHRDRPADGRDPAAPGEADRHSRGRATAQCLPQHVRVALLVPLCRAHQEGAAGVLRNLGQTVVGQLEVARAKRRMAMKHQIASKTPNGQAPERKPYMLDRAHPSAKPRVNPLPRASSAHMTIMKVRAATPKTVVQFIGREAMGGSAVDSFACAAPPRSSLVVTREDPPEQAESWVLAPAVRGARARVEPGGFLRSGDQAENDVADGEGEDDPFSCPEVWVRSYLPSTDPLPGRTVPARSVPSADQVDPQGRR